jgi:hypothetical protein
MRPVLSLPKYVALNVLKEWLTLQNICTLDSAFCNHDDRLKFLLLFIFSDVVFDCETVKSCSCLVWAVKREVQLVKVQLNILNDESIRHLEALSQLNLSVMASIRWLHIQLGVFESVYHKHLGQMLTHCTGLVDFSLTSSDHTGNTFDPTALMTHCSDMRSLRLNLKHLLPRTAQSIAHHMKGLQRLCVSCDFLSDQAVDILCSQLHSLCALSLTCPCPHTSQKTLCSISTHCHHLTDLHLNLSVAITTYSRSSDWVCPWGDRFFDVLAVNCPALTHMQIIDSSTFDRLKTNLVNPLKGVFGFLESLFLSGVRFYGTSSIAHLVAACPALTSLSLSHCSQASFEASDKPLVASGNRLVELNVTNMSGRAAGRGSVFSNDGVLVSTLLHCSLLTRLVLVNVLTQDNEYLVLPTLSDTCTRLQTLNIQRSGGLTYTNILKLLQSLQCLRELYVDFKYVNNQLITLAQGRSISIVG